MSQMKYNSQSNNNYKKILIVLFVVAFIFLFILIALVLNLKNQENNSNIDSSVRTVKDVVEYYESTYISEQVSDETGFYMDYSVKFKLPLYNDDETSNEEYYNNILKESAEVLRYESYKMIDEENGITIKVICDGNEIASIVINDIEDYFIYMDSQIDLKKYYEIEETEFNVSSEILNVVIENKWENTVNFGERDSIFDQYYIYLDEGLKVRIIQDQIYNIVFTKNYSQNVINSLFPGIDLDIVKNELGEPSFESDDSNVIGYKNESIYVFFTNDEISVYRNLHTDIEDFLELSDKLINDETDLLEFMNDLTDMWPDYSEYEYTSTSMFIAYPLKGIEIKLNYDDTNGILVYNNIKSSLSRIENYLKDTEFVSRLKIDSVFEAEQRRVTKQDNQITKCEEYINSLEEDQKNIIGESLNYNIYAESDSNGNIYSMKFISKDITRADRELNDSISYYLWITSNYFIYSKSGKGIYLYNLINGNVSRILEGTDEFELVEYKDGILKYDNSKEIKVEY